MRGSRTLLLVTVSTMASAGEPADSQMQFRAGIPLTAEPGRPLQELSLPDAVYLGATRTDLADVRVFNAHGIPVPYALCTEPLPPSAPTPEASLPVFPMQAAARPANAGTHLELSPQGAVSLDTHAAVTATAATALSAYVVDAHDQPAPLQALRLRWRASDGASELHLRVESSNDLDHWSTITADTTLVHADAGGGALDRQRIDLPVATYRYIRLRRSDAGPQPLLDEVIGELAQAETARAAPLWFETSARGTDSDRSWRYDDGRVAAIETARILLPVSNLAVPMVLQSRSDERSSWRNIWAGTVYTIASETGELRSADLRFAPDGDRQWRLLVPQGAESLAGSAPRLRLGYRPLRLRFMAEGDGPFLLAYGSARASPSSPPDCNALVPNLAPDRLQTMIGSARAGSEQPLAGDAALKPGSAPLPRRSLLLWSLLVLGAGAVVLMALNLIRSIRRG